MKSGTTGRCLLLRSIQDHGTERYLRLLRLDAEDDELLAAQSPPETLLVQLVLVGGEAEGLIALVGDPLPRALGPQVGQVALKGSQCLLLQGFEGFYFH